MLSFQFVASVLLRAVLLGIRFYMILFTKDKSKFRNLEFNCPKIDVVGETISLSQIAKAIKPPYFSYL
jgi:hypothetical protein